MDFSMQRANGWKRISAFLFDAICLSMLAVAFAYLISIITGYNEKITRLNEIYKRYESEYGIVFNITQEEYENYTPEKKAGYDAALSALSSDSEAMRLFQLVSNLMLLMITFGLLAAFLIVEFLVPLRLKDGRTFGKKIFGIAVMDVEAVRIRTVQLFVRTLLGKFACETMIPVYMIVMLFFNNTISLFGLIVTAGLLIGQAVIFLTTETRSLIHDKLAQTVVVDYASQKIFETREEMIAAKAQAAAEKAAHREW